MILAALGIIALVGVAGFFAWDRHRMCTALIEGSLRKYHATDIHITLDWLDFDRDTFTYDVEYRDRAGRVHHNRCKVSSQHYPADEAVYWTEPLQSPARKQEQITTMDPAEMRRVGAAILEQVLSPLGFGFEAGEVGKGSGGPFAQGAFVRGNRRLEFSTRYSLGLVEYRVGSRVVSHEDYMRVVAGRGNNAYPGFSDDPIDGFRHLASDLQQFAGVFIDGSDAEFDALVAEAQSSRPQGLKSLVDPAVG